MPPGQWPNLIKGIYFKHYAHTTRSYTRKYVHCAMCIVHCAMCIGHWALGIGNSHLRAFITFEKQVF